MRPSLYLGVDIGTSSSKGVIVDSNGQILMSAVREHDVSRPHPGHVEMDSMLWWEEFVSITRELIVAAPGQISAVGASGMGPCVVAADAVGRPIRPAILYGIDTRASRQITALTEEFGQTAIVERCGSALTTQSVGPKLLWLSEHEPDNIAQMLFMPSSWLVWNLTGRYVLDHHSASQCTPMYDTAAHEWITSWSRRVAPDLRLPELCWPGDVVGHVSARGSAETGLPQGIPVIGGTIDAWAEAISVGAQHDGDLMLMYGTTMFLINTCIARPTSDVLWGTVGALPGTYNLAAGMATSGAITAWLRALFGSPEFSALLTDAERAGPGSGGVLMLPYFSGERSPLSDPDARGTIAGLTVSTTRGEMYRAALESTAFGVRHNLEALAAAGGNIGRVVAVGGGTQGELWTQVVSDITGVEQILPRITIGASYGSAFLAASAVESVQIENWNPTYRVIRPRRELRAFYDAAFVLYRDLYEATADLTHRLVALTQG
jgi:xylulokinase